MNRSLVLAAWIAGLPACARPTLTELLTRATWVDLTYAFDSETIYWPTAKPFQLEVVSAQRTPGGYYYAANNFAAAEHGGTHLDAALAMSARTVTVTVNALLLPRPEASAPTTAEEGASHTP